MRVSLGWSKRGLASKCWCL